MRRMGRIARTGLDGNSLWLGGGGDVPPWLAAIVVGAMVLLVAADVLEYLCR